MSKRTFSMANMDSTEVQPAAGKRPRLALVHHSHKRARDSHDAQDGPLAKRMRTEGSFHTGVVVVSPHEDAQIPSVSTAGSVVIRLTNATSRAVQEYYRSINKQLCSLEWIRRLRRSPDDSDSDDHEDRSGTGLAPMITV